MIDWQVLRPRHGFFAQDARGWYAGSSGRGRSLLWPMPTTVRGACCTALGREIERAKGRINTSREWLDLKAEVKVQALLALRAPALDEKWSAAHRMWPAPSDALHSLAQGTAMRLVWSSRTPTSGSGLLDTYDDPRAANISVGELRDRQKPAAGPRWWSDTEFVGWLLGKNTMAPHKDVRGREPALRVDVHVKMDPLAGTAERSKLWAADFRETLVDARPSPSDSRDICTWAMGVGLDLGPQAHAVQTDVHSATFGGERRIADIDPAGEELGACPVALLDAVDDSGGVQALRLYAVTPAVFDSGWCPDGFELKNDKVGGLGPANVGDLVLTGAIIPRAMPISGWEMQSSTSHAGPRDLSWAVPPGAVFGVRRADGEPFTKADVEMLWLAQWGRRADDGFGRLVPGIEPAGAPDAAAKEQS